MTDDDFWENIKTLSEEEEEENEEELRRAVAGAAENEVVCRVCASAFGQITHQHLQTHGKTLSGYQRDYPDAPIHPEAPERQPGREEGYEHSEETKRRISEGVRDTGGEDGA